MPVLGTTLNITATFRDPDGALVDPDSISVELFDEDGNDLVGATPDSPTRLSLGKFRYTWVPDVIGNVTVVFTGQFVSADDIVLENVFVITEDNEDSTAPILMEDVTILFSSGYNPMLVDPELVAAFYPEAPLIEIAQWVHKFSVEVSNIFANGDYPDIAFDYIQAATLCALSRQYEGMGTSNYTGFTLGDLQVMDTTSAQNSKKDRGNATTWCELAETLRKEMKMTKGGITSSVKAGSWCTPIPSRRLRKAGRGSGYRR